MKRFKYSLCSDILVAASSGGQFYKNILTNIKITDFILQHSKFKLSHVPLLSRSPPPPLSRSAPLVQVACCPSPGCLQPPISRSPPALSRSPPASPLQAWRHATLHKFSCGSRPPPACLQPAQLSCGCQI
ncbi:hypothetical protein BRADI_4g16678v3 [Brachypodium distachyon]|uniref:Uncharacterized protein n=1 Tax=Brachypodium distachyon TaxID=15368 RepID=A0A0Q3L6M7_BRADI|nr:hypothetical protein BRADI_4g16678v3 [Brachypodium distachyon]